MLVLASMLSIPMLVALITVFRFRVQHAVGADAVASTLRLFTTLMLVGSVAS